MLQRVRWAGCGSALALLSMATAMVAEDGCCVAKDGCGLRDQIVKSGYGCRQSSESGKPKARPEVIGAAKSQHLGGLGRTAGGNCRHD
jgi:hypothetical protein